MTVSADRVAWNLLGLAVDLGGLEVRAAGGGRTILSVKEIHARLPLRSLFNTWTFDVELERPELWLELDAQGHWNVPLLNEGSAPEAAAPNPAPAPLQLPDYNIRTVAVRGLALHFRREDFAVDTAPVDLTANLALATLQGRAALSIGGVQLQLGDRSVPIDALDLDAHSASDHLTATLSGQAPGVRLDSTVELASVRRFEGLSGSVSVLLQPEQVPSGLLPAGLAGAVSVHVDLAGSPRAPRLTVDVQAPGLRLGGMPATLSAQASLAEDRSWQATIHGTAAGAAVEGTVAVASPAAGAGLSGQLQADVDMKGLGSALGHLADGRVTLGVQLGGRMDAPIAKARVESQNLAWERMPMPSVQGDVAVALPGQGAPAQADASLDLVATSDPHAAIRPSGRVRLALRDGALELKELRVEDGPGRLNATGRLGADGGGDLNLAVHAPALARYAAALGTELAGALDLKAHLQGPVSQPNGSLQINLADGSYAGNPLHARGTVELERGVLRFQNLDVQAAGFGGQVSGTASVARLLAGQREASANLRVEGLRLRGSDLGPLSVSCELGPRGIHLKASLLEGPLTVEAQLDPATLALQASAAGRYDLGRLAPLAGTAGLAGLLVVDLKVSGTTAEPAPSGTVSVRGLDLPGQLQADALQIAVQAVDRNGRAGVAASATLDGLVLEGRPMGATALEVHADPPLGSSVVVDGHVFGSMAEVQARLQNGAASGVISLDDFDLGPWIPEAADPNAARTGSVSGRLEFSAAASTLETLRATLRLDRLVAQVGPTALSLAHAPATVRLAEAGQLSAEDLELDLGGGDHLRVQGSADLLKATGQADLDLGLDLAKLAPFLAEPIQGRIQAHARLSEKGASGEATTEALAIRGRELGASKLHFDAPAPLGDTIKLGAELLGGQAVASVELRDGGVDGSLDLHELDLGTWLAVALPGGAESRGTLSGQIRDLGAESEPGRGEGDGALGSAGRIGPWAGIPSRTAARSGDPGARRPLRRRG